MNVKTLRVGGDQLKIKSVRWNALHTYKLND